MEKMEMDRCGATRTTRRLTRNLVISLITGALAVCALIFTPLTGSAQAFTIQGGTAAQQAYAREVIEACSLPYASTDAELKALGPVRLVFARMDGVSGYSDMGVIYANSDLPPGELLGELVAHEWAHQIWYSLGPKWWQKWEALCGGPHGASSDPWRTDPAENFAECAKVGLWDARYTYFDYACTDLAVTTPEALRAWLDVARYVRKCPFADLGPKAMPTSAQDDELAAAASYVYTTGIMQGYSATEFKADVPLTRQQLATVCQRAGLTCPGDWRVSSRLATRAEVRDVVPGLTWTAGNWSQPLTRGQLARLIWRSR